MPKMYKSQLNVGGRDKLVVAINHTEETETKSSSVSFNAIHNVILIDQSQSMHREIFTLIEQVKQSVQAMSDNDYISIVGFSSHNQCRTVLKGARKDPKINDILDTMKQVLSMTCFSTPLRTAEEIADDLMALCPNVAVTLFTDGNPVTPWSEHEEENMIHKVLDSLSKKIIALNTIGYGYYYNQDLLLSIANRSEFGVFTHQSRITDYEKIFNNNYERISELAVGTIDVKAKDTEIIYLSDKHTKVEKEHLHLGMMAKNKNQIFVVADGDFTFEYNGEQYSSTDIKNNIRTDTQRNFYYAYSYNLYYHGRRQEALNILVKNLGDKGFVDNQLNTFTYDEVANYSEKLNRAVFNVKKRYLDGTCHEDYLPSDDQVCVMDVLKTLSTTGKNFYVPLPWDEYNRVGKRNVDTYNILQSVTEENLSPFGDLVFHKTRLNISVRFFSKKTASLNPKAAARVGLPESIEVEQVRHQTIVTDGNLNVKRIEAVINEETYDRLFDMEVEFEVQAPTNADGYTRVNIPLEELPIINRSYINKSTDYVLDTVDKLLKLEAQQKVLRHYLKDIRENTDYKEGAYKNYTNDQIEVLKDHGIDYRMNYSGIKNEMQDTKDFYETRVLQFQIKGAVNLPKVEEIFEKARTNGKMNTITKYMRDFIVGLHAEAKKLGLDIDSAVAGDFIKTKITQIKSEIVKERMDLNSLKIAKIVTGDWFEGAIVDSKGNFTFAKNDTVLIIKTEREKVEI